MPTERPRFEPAKLRFLWRGGEAHSGFRRGVSLHSHTLHSRELLNFIPRLCKRSAVFGHAVRMWEARYQARWGRPVDYSRAWWTPPVCANQALHIETEQIESLLGIGALVSITDHDNMDAARLLSMTNARGSVIWSVEWTVPYRGIFLHLGVHNISPKEVDARFTAMMEFTRQPDERNLSELLEWLHEDAGSLVILNHPLWDESGVGPELHASTVGTFLERYGQFIHGLELNGLRSWHENKSALQLAHRFSLPAVSGGDRHGHEPNALLNLTNAASFSEFSEEIRTGRQSEILVMPQYRQCRTLRLMQNVFDIVGRQPAHSFGWTDICDRVFHVCEDGSERALSQILAGRSSRLSMALNAAAHISRLRPFRSALRLALGAEEVG